MAMLTDYKKMDSTKTAITTSAGNFKTMGSDFISSLKF